MLMIAPSRGQLFATVLSSTRCNLVVLYFSDLLKNADILWKFLSIALSIFSLTCHTFWRIFHSYSLLADFMIWTLQWNSCTYSKNVSYINIYYIICCRCEKMRGLICMLKNYIKYKILKNYPCANFLHNILYVEPFKHSNAFNDF